MVLDYKNYSKGYKTKPPRRRLGRYVLILVAIGAVYGSLYLYAGRRLSRGRVLAEQGDIAEARKSFEAVRKLHVRGREAEDGLGVVELLGGNIAAAREHLLKGGDSAFDPARVVSTFVARGQYAQAVQYAEYAHGWDKAPSLAIEFAAAQLGLQKANEAGKLLGTQPPPRDQALAARKESVQKVLDVARKSGQFTFVSDRSNTPLASYPFGSQVAPVDVEIAGGLRLGTGLSGEDAHNHTLLNIDRELQDAAAASLNYPGAVVVIDPKTGEILAAVSNPPPGDTSTNVAFEALFEPGSIIKLLTLSAALRADLDFSTIFPFKCTGSLDCDGQPFYDWAVHREVEDIDQATAESCNIAFARIGMALGREALRRELRAYGFDRPPEAAAPIMRFGLTKDAPADSMHTAHYSVGLEDLSISPVHAAMIAGAIANNGNVMVPRLLRERRNILQEPYLHSQPDTLFSTGISEEDRATLVRVMTKVVESETGTGRRAAVEGLPFAIKTGTSGRRELGLDSVLIGIAPREAPKIAFCIYAHGAGKAELEGARILKEFLTRVKARLQT
ncbi:MAG: hypothetical protein HYX75_11415 [Acidobacteria bacterium]|nr:hypothetical protein [Acidobacteriota bacterium]